MHGYLIGTSTVSRYVVVSLCGLVSRIHGDRHGKWTSSEARTATDDFRHVFRQKYLGLRVLGFSFLDIGS